MNKKEFMCQLDKELKRFPKEDRQEALQYYEEYFAEMGVDDETDISDRVSSPKDVAAELLEQCTQKYFNEQKKKGGMKNTATMVWLVILGVLASPIAIPIVIVVLALLFSLIVVAVSLLFAAVCVGASVAAGGVGAAVSTLWAVGAGQKLCCLGVGLVAMAAGVLVVVVLIKLLELLERLIAYVFHKIVNRKKGKHE